MDNPNLALVQRVNQLLIYKRALALEVFDVIVSAMDKIVYKEDASEEAAQKLRIISQWLVDDIKVSVESEKEICALFDIPIAVSEEKKSDASN